MHILMKSCEEQEGTDKTRTNHGHVKQATTRDCCERLIESGPVGECCGFSSIKTIDRRDSFKIDTNTSRETDRIGLSGSGFLTLYRC